MFITCKKIGFKDPWKIKKTWQMGLSSHLHLDTDRPSDLEQNKIRAEAEQLKAAGKKAFVAADQMISKEAEEKKSALTNSLEEFARATGIDQKKTINKVEACKQPWELNNLESKLKESALDYIENKLIGENPVFKTIPGLENLDKPSVDSIKKDYLDWAKSLPLYGNDGKDTVASFIIHFKDFIKEREEFKTTVLKQSSFVQKEFYRDLAKQKATNPKASEETLLNKILGTLKGVETAPSAVQHEYRKLDKTLSAEEKTKIVLTAHQEKTTKYNKIISENIHLFGGNKVGNSTEAAEEFKDWYQKRKTFLEMDRMLDLLENKVLPEREKLYTKRDEMLAHLPAEEQKKMLELTCKMRFHTLRDWVKENKSKIQKMSTEVLKYNTYIDSAYSNGIAIFNKEETDDRKKMILVEPLDLQEAELKILIGREIPEREKLIGEYMKLPERVRRDREFQEGNIYDKKQILKDFQAQLTREDQNPFAVVENKYLDQKEKNEKLAKAFLSKEGQMELGKTMEKMKEAESVRVISTITNKVGKYWDHLKNNDMSQVEGKFEQNAKWGLRYNKDIWKGAWEDGIAQTKEQQMHANMAKTDLLWMQSGMDRKAGGEITKLKTISHDEWMHGKVSALETIKSEEWSERILFENETGSDERDPQKKNMIAMVNNLKLLLAALETSFRTQGAGKEVKDAMLIALTQVDGEFADAAAALNLDEVNAANNHSNYSEAA